MSDNNISAARSPELKIVSAKRKGTIFPLNEKVITIGRASSCDICIQDPSISSLHCQLERTPSGSFLVKDSSSTNGTRLNEKLIKIAELKHGNILRVGQTEMSYNSNVEEVSHHAVVDIDEISSMVDVENSGIPEVKKKILKSNFLKEIILPKLIFIVSIVLAVIIIALVIWLLVFSK